VITYPAVGDYVKAVQQPAKAFSLPELQKAKFEVDPRWQVPRPATGSSAVVFRAKVHGRDEALRFFTRDDASSRDRYRTLNQYVAARGLAGHVATSSWEDNAITVNGRKWPMVRMEWIEGRPLDKYTEALVERNDTRALADLAQLWRLLVKRLQDAEFAHGDLQHGNVLVDQSCRLRLVDLDGCWITPFEGQKAPSEQGHPNYQRPSRQWDRWMDTFPALVVYLSLTALSKNPESWDELYVEDNLLFEKDDFTVPYQTDVWRRLDTLNDGQVTALARRLRECCDPGWSATGSLESLLVRRWWNEPQMVAAPPVVVAPSTARLPKPPAKTFIPPSAPPPPRVATPSSGIWWGPQATGPLPPLVPPQGPPPGPWWNPPSGGTPPLGQPVQPGPPARSGGSGTPPVRRSPAGPAFGWGLLAAAVAGVAAGTAGAQAAAFFIAFLAGAVVFVLVCLAKR
jgi:eukaryotic-like serine/threonine-protein kinase